MTLVVARRCENRIYMVSDTKFSPEIVGDRNGQHHYIGGLKIVLLHPGVAIAFANNVENARQALEGIHSRGIDLFDKNAVLEYLLDCHQRSRQSGCDAEVEFLAAFVLDTEDSELFVIKNGNIVWGDAGYIGNTLAYNSFLHREQSLAATAFATFPPFAIAMEALNAVIRDPSPECQDVDGLLVAMRQSADAGFAFTHRVSVEGNPVAIGPEPIVGAPITFGGAAAGANEWATGSTPGDGFGVLTAFCHTASFGIIYRPALNFEPRIVRGCTAHDLVAESMTEVTEIQTLLARP